MRRINSTVLQRALQIFASPREFQPVQQFTSLLSFEGRGPVSQFFACAKVVPSKSSVWSSCPGASDKLSTSAANSAVHNAALSPFSRSLSTTAQASRHDIHASWLRAASLGTARAACSGHRLQPPHLLTFTEGMSTRVELQRNQRLGRSGFRHDPTVQAQYLVSIRNAAKVIVVPDATAMVAPFLNQHQHQQTSVTSIIRSANYPG